MVRIVTDKRHAGAHPELIQAFLVGSGQFLWQNNGPNHQKAALKMALFHLKRRH
nr:MAG TPA: hypothetical protein [Caudoviricetes sp.]